MKHQSCLRFLEIAAVFWLDCGHFSLVCQDSMVMESVFIEISDNTFKHL